MSNPGDDVSGRAPDAPQRDGTAIVPASAPADPARRLVQIALAIAAVALLCSLLLWQRLSNIQEQLARQSADSGTQAIEARALSRQAQETVSELASRVGVIETRMSEVSLQRTQLEELIQSLSRSRDENLAVDIESALRLAQQQSQLTGSLEPLIAALRTAEQRLARTAQPRLQPARAALLRDLDRVRSVTVVDLPGMLARMDELTRQVDDLPVANAVAAAPARPAGPAARPLELRWWEQGFDAAWRELRALVRVSRIENPEAALLSPEQSFFLRENLKLKLLNARLGVLARQGDSVRSDLLAAQALVQRYFDGQARRTQAVLATLSQLLTQARPIEVPRLDDSLSALQTAAAGR